MEITKLPQTELEIMIIIWESQNTVTSDYIMEHLPKDKDWSKTTVLTFLSRLIKRGFLSLKKDGRVNLYTPIIAEKDYLEMEGKTLIGKMCNNSVADFVATLYQSNGISKEDIADLKKLIEEMK